MPSPLAVNVPDQYGVPSQFMAASVGYGPHSSAVTVARRAPRPLTKTSSVTVSPGAVACLLIWVRMAGVPMATVVSEATAHSLFWARTKPAAAIDSV